MEYGKDEDEDEDEKEEGKLCWWRREGERKKMGINGGRESSAIVSFREVS